MFKLGIHSIFSLIQSLGIHRDDRIDVREYLISPLLGEKRLRPAPLSLSEITKLDIILVSHNHFDHLGMHSYIKLHETRLT
jgi:N-acyl-phosphatidylethanolamine-hydrolysing phospholipase D